MSTQAPPQKVPVPGQLHTPPLQERPPSHGLLQLPQFVRLVWVSTQAPPHSVPERHAQAPLAQSCPVPQTVSQVPQ